MADSTSHDSRLYARVDVLEHTVDRIDKGVNELAKGFREFVERQSSLPRPIPFKEIVATMGATIAVVFGVLQFLDARATTATELAISRLKLELIAAEQRSQIPRP